MGKGNLFAGQIAETFRVLNDRILVVKVKCSKLSSDLKANINASTRELNKLKSR